MNNQQQREIQAVTEENRRLRRILELFRPVVWSATKDGITTNYFDLMEIALCAHGETHVERDVIYSWFQSDEAWQLRNALENVRGFINPVPKGPNEISIDGHERGEGTQKTAKDTAEFESTE